MVLRVVPLIFQAQILVFYVLRPSWMAKAWLIILISLPDSEKDFAYFLKIMGYLIDNSRSNSFFLSVINIEIAKYAPSFLAFWGTCWHNRLFICRCST